MRTSRVVIAALLMPLFHAAAQNSPKVPAMRRTTMAEFPDKRVYVVVPALDGKRFYYLTSPDTLSLYDVATKRSTVIAGGEMNGLTVSAKGDLIAFARLAEGERERIIWTIPLDVRTGLASGAARRASTSRGRSPAISPDSKWIAFASDSGRKTIAVVPSNGGSERRVVTADGSLGALEWSSDGTWIYFSSATATAPGSNNVETPGARRPHEALMRVAASGGKPEPLTEVVERMPSGSTWGISRDDGFIAYARFTNPTASLADLIESGGAVNDAFLHTVADLSGRQLAVIPALSYDRAHWMSGSRLLTWDSYRPNALKSLSIANGSVRELLPSTYMPHMPVWNPSGTAFAATGMLGKSGMRADSNVLVIANADGSNRRLIRLDDNDWFGDIAWSPDGQWIAVMPTSGVSITAVNVASGKVQTLRATGSIFNATPALRWTADSRRVRYLSGTRPKEGGLRTIRETGLDGRDTLVQELLRGFDPTTRAGQSWNLRFLSDTSVVFGDSSATFVGSLSTGKSVKVYGETNGLVGASPDGSLLAIRPFPSDRGATLKVDVITSSGKPVTTVTFKSGVGSPVLNKPLFTPDGKRLIVTGRTPTNDCCAVYEAALSGAPVKMLADSVSPAGPLGGPPVMAMSPDGKTLLFTTSRSWVTTIQSVDVSSLTRNASKKK